MSSPARPSLRRRIAALLVGLCVLAQSPALALRPCAVSALLSEGSWGGCCCDRAEQAERSCCAADESRDGEDRPAIGRSEPLCGCALSAPDVGSRPARLGDGGRSSAGGAERARSWIAAGALAPFPAEPFPCASPEVGRERSRGSPARATGGKLALFALDRAVRI